MEQLQNLDLPPAYAVGAALLRFILAGFWIAHWWFKVGYRGMPATEAFFKQQGLPVSLAWFVIRFEVVIAAGLILGIGVPLLCVTRISVITQIEGLVYEAFEGQAFGMDDARWNGLPNSGSHRL
jgi:uncharacterized membrane protein YphA (DoxX/SURF4 family)